MSTQVPVTSQQNAQSGNIAQQKVSLLQTASRIDRPEQIARRRPIKLFLAELQHVAAELAHLRSAAGA
jgi:hypothetical protein